MSARNYSQVLGANEVIRLPAGRYFFIRTAAAALDISTEGNPGSPLKFGGIGAGSKFGPVADGQGWKFLVVTNGATPQAIEIVISDDGNFEVASTVTVSGSVTTVAAPANTVVGTAPVINNAAQSALIAANLARKRFSFSLLSTAVTGAAVFARATGLGVNLYEIQPGVIYNEEGTFGLDIRNDSGAALTFMVAEYA